MCNEICECACAVCAGESIEEAQDEALTQYYVFFRRYGREASLGITAARDTLTVIISCTPMKKKTQVQFSHAMRDALWTLKTSAYTRTHTQIYNIVRAQNARAREFH